MTGKIAYIMSRFPHLPETFILREMIVMRDLGWEVELFPLLIQEQAVIHNEAREWMKRAHRLPVFSVQILAALLSEFVHSPVGLTRLFFRMIWENRTSLKFLLRALALYPMAVYAARLMRAVGIQHIHAHYATHPALAAWIIHRLTGIPYSITVHAHDIFVERAMLSTKIEEAQFVAAISEFNREFLAEHIGEWVRDRVEIVHCGIQSQYYALRVNPRQPFEPLRILSIGSLQPYKGQKHLLDACAELKRRGIPFHCQVIGGGELKEVLAAQIEHLGLTQVVELTGPLPQDEVAKRLPAAHCYVQPSVITSTGKMEGIPVALMEALASGVPVVASRLSGIPELVKPGITGWLVEPGDAIQLADAIEQVYLNPELAHKIAQNGRNLVEREFNQESSARKLAALFERSIRASTENQSIQQANQPVSDSAGKVSQA